jgi:hypothetical protein
MAATIIRQADAHQAGDGFRERRPPGGALLSSVPNEGELPDVLLSDRDGQGRLRRCGMAVVSSDAEAELGGAAPPFPLRRTQQHRQNWRRWASSHSTTASARRPGADAGVCI